MISAGCQPVTLGRVWVGETLPSPELLAMALTDPEDRPPLQRGDHEFCTCWECSQPDPNHLEPLTLMPNDQDDSRNAATTPAPPPSEPTTRTENEKPVAIQALRPPPLKYDASFLAQEDSVFSRAVQLVAEVGNDIDRDRNERRDAAESAATGQALLLKQNAEILAAIQKADDNNNKNYELLRTEILHLKESDVKQDLRLKEGDARFKQIEDSITELKSELIALVTREMKLAADKIEALEQQLAEAKANDPARQAPAPTG